MSNEEERKQKWLEERKAYRDGLSTRADVVKIMGRDEKKPVGYFLMVDGMLTWVETKIND